MDSRSKTETGELSDTELATVAGGCPLSALVAGVAVATLGKIIDAAARAMQPWDYPWEDN
jgi:hypothetical protein